MLHGAEFMAHVFLVPPLPCHRLCRDEVSLFLVVLWGKGRALHVQGQRDESLEKGGRVQGCGGVAMGNRTATAGKWGWGAAAVGGGLPKSVCIEGRNSL